MGRFYQHAKSPSDSSLTHRGAGPKQFNLEVKKSLPTDNNWHVYKVLRNYSSMVRE